MKRLSLGLTGQERRVREAKRRERNCLIAILICIAVVGFFSYPA